MSTLTDDFAGTANPIGSPWTTIDSLTAMQKVPGFAEASVINSSCGAYISTVTPANDQYSQYQIHTLGPTSSREVCVRVDTGSFSYYGLQILGNDPNGFGSCTIKLRLVSTGSEAAVLASNTFTVSADDIFKCEVKGTITKGYQNGNLILTGTPDSTLTGGRWGMFTFCNAATLAGDQTAHFFGSDEFGGAAELRRILITRSS